MSQEGSYYSRRSARDPAWRERQIQDATERERRRFQEDPDGVRDRRNATARGWYTRLREDDPDRFVALRRAKTERDRRRRATLTDDERTALRAADAERKRRGRARGGLALQVGRTLEELHARIGGDAETLALILREEVRSGRIELHHGRYSLNGGIPDDVKRALRDHLEPDDD